MSRLEGISVKGLFIYELVICDNKPCFVQTEVRYGRSLVWKESGMEGVWYGRSLLWKESGMEGVWYGRSLV